MRKITFTESPTTKNTKKFKVNFFGRLGSFCVLGRFVSWVVLCLGSFCTLGRIEFGSFFSLSRFVMVHFALGSFCALVRF
jgi:hypothetical protein